MAGHFIPFTVLFLGGHKVVLEITGPAFPSGYTGRVIATGV
jgi:hypothetical protein